MTASAHDPTSDVRLAVRPLTVDEYHRLVEAGILDPDERVELLDGLLAQMAPIGPEHQFVLDRLNRILTRQENGSYLVGPGRPIWIPEHNEPQPDLVVYRSLAESRFAHTVPGDVLLVVEISAPLSTRTPAPSVAFMRQPGSRNTGSLNYQTGGFASCASERTGVITNRSSTRASFPQ